MNSSCQQPDQPTFFVDRALGGIKVPTILSDACFTIEIHSDHFPDDSPDAEWLTEVGKRGWVVLSKDKRIRRRPLELNALLKAKVAAFVLTSGNLTGEKMGDIFVRAKSKILKFVTEHPRPFLAAVTRGGRVNMIITSVRDEDPSN